MRTLLPVVLAALAGCAGGARPDPEADRAEITRLLAGARTAHLDKRADLMTLGFADSVVVVQRGEVTAQRPDSMRRRLQAYFDRSTFQAWDDIEPPRITVSADGSLAWAIVHKRVRLTAPDSTGVVVSDHTVFAWVELYRKIGGRWRLVGIASTDRPGDSG